MCIVERCDRPPTHGPLCALHESARRRVAARQLEVTSGCYEWTGTRVRNNGPWVYGSLKIGKQRTLAHRAVLMLQGVAIHGLVVCHHCDNPACVRIDHLFVGTHKDNAVDRHNKGRDGHTPGFLNGAYTKPHRRPYGERNGSVLHPETLRRGEAHHNAKFTEADVGVIRKMAADGHGDAAIGRLFGASRMIIRSIRIRKTWRHLP